MRRGGSPRSVRLAFHKTEIEKWWPVINAAGVKAQ
jgi:hypothetical protein